MHPLATPTSSDASASNPVVIQTPTTTPSSPSFHPALAVTNIKNFIPLILDQEDGQYWSWVELFKIHACVYHVLDHIDDSIPRPSEIDDTTCHRLDAVVKQRIYETISKDLLLTIIKTGASAHELWTRLEEKFQDNKNTRAVYLEEQFNSTRLENFSNMSEYCRQIKLVVDQLANVGNPILETKMVLQLVAGLPKGEFDTLATMIQQADPLPSFNKARSQLLLEETRRSKQDDHNNKALAVDTTTHGAATAGEWLNKSTYLLKTIQTDHPFPANKL